MPLYLCFFITQKSWRVDNQLVVVNAVFSAAPCSAGRSAAEISAGSINSFMKPTKSLGRAWRRLSQWGTESHWANSPPSWSSHPPPLHHSLQTHSSPFSSRLLPEKKTFQAVNPAVSHHCTTAHELHSFEANSSLLAEFLSSLSQKLSAAFASGTVFVFTIWSDTSSFHLLNDTFLCSFTETICKDLKPYFWF